MHDVTVKAPVMKVLVVEDEPLIRMIMAEALEDAGHTALEAGNVLEAIGLLGAHDDIAAVITDIDMPGGLSGLDLARLIATLGKDIATIVTSGRCLPEAGDLPGGAVFFPKPYHLDDILGAVEARCKQVVEIRLRSA